MWRRYDKPQRAERHLHSDTVDEEEKKNTIRWQPFWCGVPSKIWEHVYSIDQSGLWKQHMVFSKRDGNELRGLLVQRFASSTVFLSLLLSTEIGVFFSPSDPADNVRVALKNIDYGLEFYTGVALCLSIMFSIAALTSNWTAWSIFSVVSAENIHAVMRSSIGIYGTTMPARLIIIAIYLFYLWVCLFWFVIMPLHWAIILTIVGLFLVIHIFSTYSAIGQVIMSTRAMGHHRVLDDRVVDNMEPYELHQTLLHRNYLAKSKNIPVMQLYRNTDLEAGDDSPQGSAEQQDAQQCEEQKTEE